MDQGFIVLHRKIFNHPIFDHTGLVHLFITLLLLACHKEERFLWNGKEEILRRGQLITGRLKLAKQLHTNPNTIKDRLKTLVSLGIITIKSTNKFSIITIVKYNQYQDIPLERTKKDTNQTPTRHQPDTTYNNVNNVTNITKVIGDPRDPEIQVLWEHSIKLGLSNTKQNLNRYAIKRLLKQFTVEQLKKALEVSQEIRQEPYAPQVNNWMDLEEKYMKLRGFFARRNKSKILVL
jgi:hypothetical protein